MMPSVVTEDAALFAPNPGAQESFIDDYQHRYCAFAGGWGAGKSFAGSRKTANLHLYNAVNEGQQPTYVASLVIAPTYQLAQTINIPQMRDAFDAMGLSHRFVADPKVYAFVLPDLGTKLRPSFIYVRSADAADKIAGFEVGAVWGDEAARWPCAREGEDPLGDAILQGDGRLRHPKARFKQMNLTYTNEGEDTRVYRDFEAEPKPDHVLYRSSTRDNVHLPPDYVAAQLAQLSPDLASQYVEGFAATLGANLLYGNYSEGHNKDNALELASGLPLQLAVDFNKNPGMHAVVGQHFIDDELLTSVDELHRGGMLIKQMMLEFYHRYGAAFQEGRFPVLELFGDVSGNTGSMKDGETYWDAICMELKAYNIPYRLRLPSHAPGIADRVNAANSAFRSATGRVRWKIHSRCARLLRDIKNLKWNGNEIDKKDKKLSHASDADTYRVHYLMPIRPIRRAMVYGGSAAPVAG
jgi:hypothetical protein